MRDLRKVLCLTKSDSTIPSVRPFVFIVQHGQMRAVWMEIARDENQAIELAKKDRKIDPNQTITLCELRGLIPTENVIIKGIGECLIRLTTCKHSANPEIGLVAELEDGRILFVNESH